MRGTAKKDTGGTNVIALGFDSSGSLRDDLVTCEACEFVVRCPNVIEGRLAINDELVCGRIAATMTSPLRHQSRRQYEDAALTVGEEWWWSASSRRSQKLDVRDVELTRANAAEMWLVSSLYSSSMTRGGGVVFIPYEAV